MLLWLEESEDRSLNRAPVLGGDRFFNATSSVSISDRIFGSIQVSVGKGIEKGFEEESKLENRN